MTMTASPRSRYVSLLVSGRARGQCAVFADLRYNRANETAAAGNDGYCGGLKEASMKRGQLVSRRSRQSRRLCPCCLLQIESAYRHRP